MRVRSFTAMKLKHHFFPNRVLMVVLWLGLIAAVFYAGLLFGRAHVIGYRAIARDQSLNLVFGIVGGVVTSALIWYWNVWTSWIVAMVRKEQVKTLTGFWEERYNPAEYKETHQEQRLIFDLDHAGPRLTGTLMADDTPQCPPNDRHGARAFEVHGLVEGAFVSLDAILQDKSRFGHTVYLLQQSDEGDKMSGWSIWYDLNEERLTAGKTTLIRRTRGDILKDIRVGAPIVGS